MANPALSRKVGQRYSYYVIIMSKYPHLLLYTDGGARGNPGPAAVGVVIKTPRGQIIEEFGEYLGEVTNNQAEYQALTKGLEYCLALGAKQVDCYLDSELVVKQLKGEYKVKEPVLRMVRNGVQTLAVKFEIVNYHHILRHHNDHADRLVNQVLDNILK